ncbi:MAG: hypothetical protein LBT89_03835, partial [Planctomycetaceae bacterium]|nr:hypothetical protein [Planctomycetaceae bacterium]
MSAEEKLTYENVLRLIKEQAIESRRERAEERAEREAADEKRWAEAEKQRLERKADDEKRWAE